MQKTLEILPEFQSTSLDQMDKVKLMNRTDTKFIFNVEKLSKILESALDKYYILEISNNRLLDYRTQYFDTDDFNMYIVHQNKKLNRFKIRQREYMISDISFLEVKFKSNKGRTIKKRIKSKGLVENLTPEFKSFIEQKTPFNGEKLVASILNSFSRITLVHKTKQERITIDLNLGYKYKNDSVVLSFLTIAEVKREGYAKSDFIDILKENKIYKQGMSKYSIGVLLFNKHLKYNTFKKKLLKIKKLADDDRYDSYFSRTN
jgi:hypothetical protein